MDGKRRDSQAAETGGGHALEPSSDCPCSEGLLRDSLGAEALTEKASSMFPGLTSSLRARAWHAVSLLRLRRFDSSTADGRSKERYRRVAWTTLASVAARGVAVLTALVSVPLTLHYLGTERYGLWMTISSTVAMLGFADLGMGNGLLNAISEANGRDDREAAREYVSSAFFMLLAVSILLGIGFGLIYSWVPWQRVFNVSESLAVAEAAPAVLILVGCFLLNVPLGIVQRVQMGYQEGFVNSLWQGLGNLMGLGGVLTAIHFRAGLPWLVFAMAGAPMLASALNGLVLFGFRRPWLRPKWNNTTSHAARRILHLGMLFFVLQIAVTFAFASDNIVAAHVLGPEAVTQYSVPKRLFSIVPMILGMALGPLWPAYGESIARGDTAWVKTTLLRSLKIVLTLTSIPAIFLVAFGAKMVRLWVGPEITPSFLLLLGLGLWMLLHSAGSGVAMFLNGANVLWFQVVCASLMASGAFVAKIVLARHVGLPGIIWGTVLAYVVCTAVPLAIYVPRLLRNWHSRGPVDEMNILIKD